MTIMFGIAALALLTNGLGQSGVDPLIDKQYAIVKPGEHIAPDIAKSVPAPNTE